MHDGTWQGTASTPKGTGESLDIAMLTTNCSIPENGVKKQQADEEKEHTSSSTVSQVYMALMAEVHGTMLAVLRPEYAQSGIFRQHLLCVPHSGLWRQGISYRPWHPNPALHLQVQLEQLLSCSSTQQ